MAAPSVSAIEQTILDILAGCPDGEIWGRDLRGLLRDRGFRRSAPALVFTLLRLQDKGLVEVREEVQTRGGVPARERFYRML